ncbi:transposase-like protein [Herbinix hemicellulosilytica]|uniref:Transposase n=1 Tax=Herbinix hemicellulosilytica TaxID=1564487 RepID=A0A0H5SEK0_HERHM|nr:transposase [Herbinix hemicellulosilytica]RBP56401.1 transposase-like protein [Herbinix hemicellulosilytica]CRZ33887.1 hypothetical protein HHT355_0683 [Herbinix hemicellulosilytica]
MIRLGTVFSGIGAIEHALDRLDLPHDIVFACDNGERKLKSKIEKVESAIEGMNDSEKNDYITQLYEKECGMNYVEQTYRANYIIKNDLFYQDVRFLDQEYKIQAVELCLEGDKSIAQVAKELGLAYNTLHRWVKEYKESNGTSFVGSGNIKPQNQEIIELRRRNQELEEELAILKKALGIFTRNQK